MAKQLPRHIGIIPDGNRRWAVEKGMGKQDVYIPTREHHLHGLLEPLYR